MKRRELKILGLSYSQSQIGSYVIVLAEKKGKKKLPIIIKPSEAQRIALEIEGIKPPRPLTHDILKLMCDAYGLDVQEAFIHTLAEGVFYTKIHLSNGIEEVEIECSPGDGLALSSLFKCPIYVSTDILDSAGILMNDDGSVPTSLSQDEVDDIEDETDDDFDDEDDFESFIDNEKNERIVSIEDLERMMGDAISNEEYEIAAELRDRIQMLKEKNK